MRITQNQGVQAARKRRASDATDEVGGFSSLLSSTGSGQQTSSVDEMSLLNPMGNLLALQDEGFIQGQPRTEYDRGMLTLERLDDLKLQLLDDRPDRALLTDIAELVRARTDDDIDPKMRDIMDEIELRAAVELAKLDQQDEDRSHHKTTGFAKGQSPFGI